MNWNTPVNSHRRKIKWSVRNKRCQQLILGDKEWVWCTCDVMWGTLKTVVIRFVCLENSFDIVFFWGIGENWKS